MVIALFTYNLRKTRVQTITHKGLRWIQEAVGSYIYKYVTSQVLDSGIFHFLTLYIALFLEYEDRKTPCFLIIFGTQVSIYKINAELKFDYISHV